MYPGYLSYQAERQLSDAERRGADRRRGEIAQALAGLFRRRRAKPAASRPQCPACARPAAAGPALAGNIAAANPAELARPLAPHAEVRPRCPFQARFSGASASPGSLASR